MLKYSMYLLLQYQLCIGEFRNIILEVTDLHAAELVETPIEMPQLYKFDIGGECSHPYHSIIDSVPPTEGLLVEL